MPSSASSLLRLLLKPGGGYLRFRFEPDDTQITPSQHLVWIPKDRAQFRLIREVLLPFALMRLKMVSLIFALFLSLANAGCTILVSSATSGLADDVSVALVDQPDPLLVRDGAPAYLILIDALIAGNPENQDLLLAASRLYSSYASAFIADPLRRQALNSTALDYGKRALCLNDEALCKHA